MKNAFLFALMIVYSVSGFTAMSLPKNSLIHIQNGLVIIDHALSPVVDSLRDGISTRPLSRVQFSNGLFFDVVNNEVTLKTNDLNVLSEFLHRWDGNLIAKYEAKFGPTLYVIKINSRAADVQNLPEYFQAIAKVEPGKIRVSDQHTMRLISVMAREAFLHGLQIGFSMDMIMTNDDDELSLFTLQSIFSHLQSTFLDGSLRVHERSLSN